jgi:thioester reductase-like protein
MAGQSMAGQGSVLVTGAGGVIGAHAAAEYARRLAGGCAD